MNGEKRIRIRQVNETRKTIVEALLQLLEKNKLSELTIEQVTSRAGYARRTFYRHFDSLDDVLTYEIDRNTKTMFETISAIEQLKFETMVEVLFNFWQAHQDLLSILNSNHRLYLIENSWLMNLDKSPLSHDDLKTDRYAQNFGLGGMYFMMMHWVNGGFTETPSEMKLVAERIRRHLI